jgi:hypothetical protein
VCTACVEVVAVVFSACTGDQNVPCMMVRGQLATWTGASHSLSYDPPLSVTEALTSHISCGCSMPVLAHLLASSSKLLQSEVLHSSASSATQQVLLRPAVFADENTGAYPHG